MTAQKFHAAIMLSTRAALQSGQVSLPEIVGILEIAKINAERQAYERHKDSQSQPAAPKILPVRPLPPMTDLGINGG